METGSRPHVIVVGGGFGGLYAARTLAHADVRLTVVDRRNHHLFQPLLYQVAMAALSTDDIAYPIRWILRRQRNAQVILGEVEAVSLRDRRIRLTDGGECAYDFLILATGASHAYFGHEEWRPFAPGLKSLEDALEIRRRILLAFERAERETSAEERTALLTFVVVGGGPTGVELAGALAEIARGILKTDFRAIDAREARVVLVEAGPRILPPFPEDLSAAAQRSLEGFSVEVRTSQPVTGVDAGGVWLGAERIAARTVLWAAGVQASPLGATLGVELDRAGRVVVEPDLTVPGHPHTYVIGDLAAARDAKTGKPVPGLAPAAMQQGEHAAANLLRTLRGEPRLPFRYRDKGNLATIGKAAAVAEIGRLHLSGLPAWLVWSFVHVLYLIGFRNRMIVLFEWAWAYVTSHRGARLITGPIEAPRPLAGGASPPATAREADPPAAVGPSAQPSASARSTNAR